MADRTEFQKENENEGLDIVVKVATQVKQEVERFVDEFNVDTIRKRVEDFGHENPVGFAVAAMTLGVFIGVLMRSPKNVTRH